jgi:hypothetical protein
MSPSRETLVTDFTMDIINPDVDIDSEIDFLILSGTALFVRECI